MSFAYARVDARARDSLWGMRAHPGVEALDDVRGVWLRARREDAPAVARLRALPDAELFDAVANEQLARRGQRVPVTHAPQGTWRPLAELLPIELPASRLPADPAAVRLLPLQPVPAHRTRPADALLTTLRELAGFAASAPLVRLARLQFAADASGGALVLGTPLPALPGLLCYHEGQLVLPCGYALPPQLDAAAAAAHLGAPPRGLVLWHADGHHQLAPAEAILPGTRAALAASLGAGHG